MCPDFIVLVCSLSHGGQRLKSPPMRQNKLCKRICTSHLCQFSASAAMWAVFYQALSSVCCCFKAVFKINLVFLSYDKVLCRF